MLVSTIVVAHTCMTCRSLVELRVLKSPPVLVTTSDKDKDIPTCRLHGTDEGCSYGDNCIYRHEDDEGNLLNDPVAARKSRKGGGRGGGRGRGSGGGRGRGRGSERTYTSKQFNNKKKEIKKLKKKLKRANAASADDDDGSESKKAKITMTKEEFENKIKEAKTSGAVTYREQVMLTKPTLDLPNPKERCLLLERVLKASKDDPDFWKGGRRVGIDSDSSLNIASKGSPFLHTVHETDRAEVNGVGGSESLSKKGQWILPMRSSDGQDS